MLPRVTKSDGIHIEQATGDVNRGRKLAVHTASLQVRYSKSIRLTDHGFSGVEDTDVVVVVWATFKVVPFVPLMLRNVESAPASGEARGKRVGGAGGCERK